MARIGQPCDVLKDEAAVDKCRVVTRAAHQALRNNHDAAAISLLEQGADPNQVNKYDGETLFMKAVRGNHIAFLELLLDKYRVDANGDAAVGFMALHDAVIFGKEDGVECLKLLLEHDADPNKVNEDEDTALHFAVLYGVKKAIKLLLEHGADPNLVNEDGNTPLTVAAENDLDVDMKGVRELLLKHGAKDPEEVNEDG